MGLMAAGVGLSSALQTIQKRLKLQIGASSYLWALHFFLLGGFTESLIQVGIGTRTWVSIILKRSVVAICAYLICTSLGFLTILAITWSGPLSLLPTFAAINSTIAYLLPNIPMRLMFFFSSLCWIISGYHLNSYPIILTETIGICMNLLGIWRILIKEHNN